MSHIAFLAIPAFLAFYAWRDWYKSLCGLIVLMATVRHPDMPRTIFGVQGLDPWNVLLLTIVVAWLAQRRSEGICWDLPRSAAVLLLLFLGIIFIGFTDLVVDRHSLPYVAPIAG